MALDLDNFCPAAGNDGNSNAPRIHTYRTSDQTGDIDAPGYFNALRKHLRAGDLLYFIEVHASTGALEDAAFHVFTSVPDTGNVILSVESVAFTLTPGS